jgi:serine/threonine protein kinase
MDQIGKYEILDKIGTGGFAVVYKGYDPYIKRPVAIKVCYSREEETRERFKREAEIAGLLEHRNITTVFDAGVHEQTPYLVEEYLSGEDLAHLIRRQEPDTLERKLDYLLQIASGLGYAHSQGVIHRDIKPGNVRVLDNGRIKIMDFGTAKLANVESNLTQTGMTLGTVAYLSPERLLGQPSGTNSDLFSYGVLAYEMLSFRRPFSGRNIPNLIDQVLNASPIPLQEAWPECPPALAEVVRRCLVKDPADRYSSCDQLQAELEAIRNEFFPQDSSGEASNTNIPAVSMQLTGLLERARELYQRGKVQRAEVLLDEVLEIDPKNSDAQRLIVACQKAQALKPNLAGQEESSTGIGTSTAPSSSHTSVWEAPDERRERKVREAKTSIVTYIDSRQFVQAAEALSFATDFLGELEEAPSLRRRISEGLQRALVEIKGDGMRQARRIVAQMDTLRNANRLPVELAETFTDWVEDLDPDDLAAQQILAAVKVEQQQQKHARADDETERKKQEAVESIENLLDSGNPQLAQQALQFAVRLFGEFEQITVLKNRIAEALLK